MSVRLRVLAPIDDLDRDPLIYREAIFRPDAAKWSEAMQKELNFLLENNIWTLQQAPAERHVLKGKWVYKKKLAGTSIKYKARWVVKGYEQEAGVDYNETYASVINRISVKCLLALITYHGWYVE